MRNEAGVARTPRPRRAAAENADARRGNRQGRSNGSGSDSDSLPLGAAMEAVAEAASTVKTVADKMDTVLIQFASNKRSHAEVSTELSTSDIHDQYNSLQERKLKVRNDSNIPDELKQAFVQAFDDDIQGLLGKLTQRVQNNEENRGSAS